MVRKLRQNGVLLLAGLLRNDEQSLDGALRLYGFTVNERVYENEWVGAVARRSQ